MILQLARRETKTEPSAPWTLTLIPVSCVSISGPNLCSSADPPPARLDPSSCLFCCSPTLPLTYSAFPRCLFPKEPHLLLAKLLASSRRYSVEPHAAFYTDALPWLSA
ncbi:hypothetical protein GQ607_015265 [Colletotrichum asianum]|uniref:Uncharacterized protein n=1 Tax=Colletotrichum asianum TaxID=702518 RepID=A0A8H3ZFS1_9PEZI|nr:hypothetical protein GQ607_015265 [Colletotrichum asianum]